MGADSICARATVEEKPSRQNINAAASAKAVLKNLGQTGPKENRKTGAQ
jgi:hypothetical protein